MAGGAGGGLRLALPPSSCFLGSSASAHAPCPDLWADTVYDALTALEMNDQLQSLSLQGCLLSNNELRLLIDALHAKDTLRNLNLSLVGLGDSMADIIAEIIESPTSCKSLVSIDLSKNGISPLGANRLAEALEKNDRLQVLALDLNNVGPAAQRITEKLINNKRPMVVLTLRCFTQGPETFTVACEGIAGQLYTVELHRGDSLDTLRRFLGPQLRHADARIRFVLSDGTILQEEFDHHSRTLAELLLP